MNGTSPPADVTIQQACSCTPWCGLPPCTGCGEDHGGHDRGGGVYLCRDCDLEERLTSMQCTTCGRMQYRTEVVGSLDLGALGAALWGERCTCDPAPDAPL